MKWNVCFLGKKFKLMSTSYELCLRLREPLIAHAIVCCCWCWHTAYTHFPNCNLRTWRMNEKEVMKCENGHLTIYGAFSYTHIATRIYLKRWKEIAENKIYFLRTWPLYLTCSLCWRDLQLVDSDSEMIRENEKAF